MFVAYNNAILADGKQTGSGLAGKKTLTQKAQAQLPMCLGLFYFMPVLQNLLSRVPSQQQDGIKSKSLIKNYFEGWSAFGRTMEERNPSNVTPDNLALERLSRPFFHLPRIRHKGRGRFSIGRSSAQLAFRCLMYLDSLVAKISNT